MQKARIVWALLFLPAQVCVSPVPWSPPLSWCDLIFLDSLSPGFSAQHILPPSVHWGTTCPPRTVWTVRPSLAFQAHLVVWRTRCVCTLSSTFLSVHARIYTCVHRHLCVYTLSRFCVSVLCWVPDTHSKQETASCSLVEWEEWRHLKLREIIWGCLRNTWIVGLREYWCPSLILC